MGARAIGKMTEYDIPRTMHAIATPLRFILKALITRKATGLENLPAAGGAVFCGNHVSSIDPVVYAWFLYEQGVPFKFLAKDSMFKWPVVGAMMTNLQQIPVARGTKDAARSLIAAVDVVKSGKPIIIFPEGTLTKEPNLWPMRGHTGAAKIALASGAPVIPMAQWGQHRILPDRGRIPKFFPRRTLEIKIGTPVDLDDLRGVPINREVLHEATVRIMAAVTELVAELRHETPPTETFQWPTVHDRT